MKVSMELIARKLGVTKNTVSLALRGMPGISKQTRKLIIDTAQDMGYEYKSKYSGAVDTASKNICLVLPRSTTESIGFFSYIQFGIENEAKRHNLNTILFYYDEDGEGFSIPLCVREGMAAGIITLGRISERTMDLIQKLHLPVVVVDHYLDGIKADCVLSDNHLGGFIAAEYLLGCGHSNIGFVGNINASVSFYDRLQGFLKAMSVNSIPVNEANVLKDTSLEELVNGSLELGVARIKSLSHTPSAFFCCNDAEAIALYKVLSSLDLTVPDNVSVIGFDDTEFARSITPGLTTLRVEKEHMGKKAVQKLLSKLETANEPPDKLIIAPSLVVRQSVAKRI